MPPESRWNSLVNCIFTACVRPRGYSEAQAVQLTYPRKTQPRKTALDKSQYTEEPIIRILKQQEGGAKILPGSKSQDLHQPRGKRPNPYHFRFLRNAAIALHNPKTAKVEGSTATAPAPNRPGTSTAMVAGSGIGVPPAQLSMSTVLVSMVTAPFRAIALPQLMVVPVTSVMLV